MTELAPTVHSDTINGFGLRWFNALPGLDSIPDGTNNL